MSFERRASQRRPAGFFLNAVEDGIPMLCIARDISDTGARIEPLFDRRASRPRQLRMEFHVPGMRKVIVTQADCVRHEDASRTIGVCFTSLSAPDRAMLRRHLASVSLT
jgi:hypothetical protein